MSSEQIEYLEVTVTPKVILFQSVDEETENTYTVLACTVGEEDKEKVNINNFGNITISGDNLTDLTIDVPRKVLLTPSVSSKYPDGYTARIPIDPIPDNAEDQWTFLSTIITENNVNAFRQVFDDDEKIISIIMEPKNHEKIKRHVIGYKEKRLAKLIQSIKEREEYARAYVLLSEYEMTDNMIHKIYNKYLDVSVIENILKNNIFKFTEVNNIGFKKIDDIYLKMESSKKEDEGRIKSGLAYYLEENQNDGNTRLSKHKLLQGTQALLDIPLPLIRDCLNKYTVKISIEDFGKILTILNENDKVEIVDFNGKYSTRSAFLAEYSVFVDITDRTGVQPNLLEYDMDDMINRFQEKEGFILSDEQRQFFLDLYKNQVSFLIGNAGSGKCLTNSTMIPTPNGFVRNGDLKVGSYVFDRLGNKTKILGVYPQGMKKVFKVILSDGREVLCNDEHIWTTFTSKGNFKNRTVREMLDLGLFATDSRPKKDGTQRRTSKFAIPANECVDYEEKELGLDPYLLGVLIANGGLTEKYLTVSTNDEFIIKKISKIQSYSYRKNSSNNYNWNFKYGNKIYTDSEQGRFSVKTKDIVPESLMVTSKYKHIPREYLESSKEQRLELLKGLMDNDGTIGVAPRYNCSYSTISPQLRDDVLELVRSLGYKATVSIDDRVGVEHHKNISYEINILIPNSEKHNLFSLPRKLERVKEAQLLKEKNRRYDRVEISDIIDMGYEEEMTCIMVDNDEHLYLCNDFVVTHNTTSQKVLLQYAKETGQTITFLAPTGIARKKLEEYTGHKAYTIHTFVLSKDMPVTNIYFIDESSMVDVMLAQKLLSRIPMGAKIVFAGDDGQIPSVSFGNFLYDCINNDTVFVNRYTKIFRQKEGGILDIVTRIKHGQAFLPNVFRERKVFGKNCVFDLKVPKGQATLADKAVQAYKNTIGKKDKYKEEDVIIITPTKKGANGTVSINNAIQKFMNPPSQDKEQFESMTNKVDVIFRVGDLVMNRKNYKEIKTYHQIGETFVDTADFISIVNGDMGKIIAIDNGRKDVYVEFDGQIVKFNMQKFNSGLVIHGWCITGHKSQGSEYKVVICIIDKGSAFQMNGNLLYTMTSRAKELLLVLGDSQTINRSLQKFENLRRETNLLYFFKMYDKLKELNGDALHE